MARILSAAFLSLFVALAAQAQDSDFPKGPAKLKDAEASGLQRLSAAQLKTLFPGKSVVVGSATGKSMRTFNADGTLERLMLKTVLKGTWHIDEKNDAYCMSAHVGTGYEENCFAVFRAPDRIHLFDYDIRDGYYSRTWRRAPAQ
jgi:hypothetical protein